MNDETRGGHGTVEKQSPNLSCLMCVVINELFPLTLDVALQIFMYDAYYQIPTSLVLKETV
jgi:hypothetical protein